MLLMWIAAACLAAVLFVFCVVRNVKSVTAVFMISFALLFLFCLLVVVYLGHPVHGVSLVFVVSVSVGGAVAVLAIRKWWRLRWGSRSIFTVEQDNS